MPRVAALGQHRRGVQTRDDYVASREGSCFNHEFVLYNSNDRVDWGVGMVWGLCDDEQGSAHTDMCHVLLSSRPQSYQPSAVEPRVESEMVWQSIDN